MLVVASFVFYAWANPGLLVLLVTCIGINAALSHSIAWSATPRRAVVLTGIGVVFNVSLLAAFKYAPLAALLFNGERREFGAWLMSIPLPIGISFYTFENISLLVDVLRKKREGEPPFVQRSRPLHFLHSALFVAFFPHLVSGPILKADTFMPQIGAGRRWTDISWTPIFKAMVLGFFLKMVVADNIKEVTVLMNYPQFVGYSSLTLILLLFAYSVQIFSDFAGYSLIAIGLAGLFGYDLPRNFNYPYISASLGEFWRRWHISLSSWLRDYLYFPLGGSRRGRWRTYTNLFLVMAIGGLWHGAAWSFAIWGLYHGLGLATERFVQETWPSLPARVPRWLSAAGVFIFISAGWLLFRLPDFSHVVAYLRCLAGNWSCDFGGGQKRVWAIVLAYAFPVVLMHMWAYAGERVAGFARWREKSPEWLIYGALLAGVLLSSGLPGSFIYFQF